MPYIRAGVQTSPVVSTIYTIQADGTSLRKVVELGKNTDNPTSSRMPPGIRASIAVFRTAAASKT